ncbi:MAG TPA: hypothetical protein VFE51_09220, partial [Verrucomicrobiae bacterium]|nr:hypothetical protein [Verrucomicrobiae bacterium]
MALFLVCADDYKPFAQPTKIKPTKSELSALLQKVEENPGDLCRDTGGDVVSLALRNTNANDRALFLASTLGSLRELAIQGRGKPETGEWTREGIACLHNLTNLVGLRILCVAPQPALQEGVFKEICNLRGLRSLSLVAASPERSDYVALSNLQNLAELRVSYATNFGEGGRDKSGIYRAREAQKSSKRPERMQQRRAMIALAPRTDQRIPDCL